MAIELGRGARARTGRQLPAQIRPARCARPAAGGCGPAPGGRGDQSGSSPGGGPAPPCGPAPRPAWRARGGGAGGRDRTDGQTGAPAPASGPCPQPAPGLVGACPRTDGTGRAARTGPRRGLTGQGAVVGKEGFLEEVTLSGFWGGGSIPGVSPSRGEARCLQEGGGLGAPRLRARPPPALVGTTLTPAAPQACPGAGAVQWPPAASPGREGAHCVLPGAARLWTLGPALRPQAVGGQ